MDFGCSFRIRERTGLPALLLLHLICIAAQKYMYAVTQRGLVQPCGPPEALDLLHDGSYDRDDEGISMNIAKITVVMMS